MRSWCEAIPFYGSQPDVAEILFFWKAENMNLGPIIVIPFTKGNRTPVWHYVWSHSIHWMILVHCYTCVWKPSFFAGFKCNTRQEGRWGHSVTHLPPDPCWPHAGGRRLPTSNVSLDGLRKSTDSNKNYKKWSNSLQNMKAESTEFSFKVINNDW